MRSLTRAHPSPQHYSGFLLASRPACLQWVPEVRHFCPSVPFVLVGCKKDLRNDAATINELKKMGQSPVTFEQGTGVAAKIEAYKYMECSARTKVRLRIIAAIPLVENSYSFVMCVEKGGRGRWAVGPSSATKMAAIGCLLHQAVRPVLYCRKLLPLCSYPPIFFARFTPPPHLTFAWHTRGWLLVVCGRCPCRSKFGKCLSKRLWLPFHRRRRPKANVSCCRYKLDQPRLPPHRTNLFTNHYQPVSAPTTR